MTVVENAPEEQQPSGLEGAGPGDARKVIPTGSVDALVVREVMKRVGIAQAGER